MDNQNMITLLPNLGDTPYINPQDKLKRLNIIMKLNNLQILKMLSNSNNPKIKFKVVLKDGKIIGFRKINEDGKVEIIKCSSVKENIGNLYYKIDNFGVNLGTLDYRLNLINYKPEIENSDLVSIENLKTKVRIIEFIMKSNPDITNNGIKFKNGDIIPKFPLQYEPIIREFKELIDWKWVKYIKQCENPNWLKKLYIQGYRPNDVFTMIYTGKINKDIIDKKQEEREKRNKEEKKEEEEEEDKVEEHKKEGIIDEKYEVDVEFSDASTSKSSTNTSVFSRSRTSSSGTSPDVKDIKESKEIKKEIKRKSFKEYQMEKLNKLKRSNEEAIDHSNLPKKPCIKEEVEKPGNLKPIPSKPLIGSPINRIPTPAKCLNSNQSLPSKPIPTKPHNLIPTKELIIDYQSKYKDYYKLYQELKEMEIKSSTSKQENDSLNIKINKLLTLHNELEIIRFRLK